MTKYIKKPVAVNAVEFTQEMINSKNYPDGVEMIGHEVEEMGMKVIRALPTIKTLEGPMIVSVGDFIITGVKGEKYPCKPDIFEKTYYTEQEYAELGL
jgi:hypothetical protein